MKSLLGFILLTFLASSVTASGLTATEKKQRKLVSRFYEALEMMPNRCPESVRKEYLNSVKSFEKAFPEFILLVNKSKFRSYAISKFSNKSPLSENACLYIKGALDAQISTKKGKIEMDKNTTIMRNNGKNT